MEYKFLIIKQCHIIRMEYKFLIIKQISEVNLFWNHHALNDFIFFPASINQPNIILLRWCFLLFVRWIFRSRGDYCARTSSSCGRAGASRCVASSSSRTSSCSVRRSEVGKVTTTSTSTSSALRLVLQSLYLQLATAVRAFAHGAMGRRIDPSWWTHWAISRSSQCYMTGVTKAVVCAILSVVWCI